MPHFLPATPSTLTVTQVVDQRQGVHGRIDERCFPYGPGVAG